MNNIQAIFPNKQINNHNKDLYIADYSEQTKTTYRKKGVKLSDNKPNDIESFHIKNDKNLSFSSIILDKKDLIDREGNPQKHCECALFPYLENPNNWILFVELKYSYSKNIDNKIREAEEQLFSTYNYFKENEIINNKKLSYLIISFPKKQPPFTNFIESPSNIIKNKRKKNIILRYTNSIKIDNTTKLSF
ncbi:MAG: hypothetical protein LBM25_02495 [Bacteroidales bacterium]|jgi:hypothetical protein|nr:hypothetical protein [Bacteroidales bacterium]